MLRDYSLQFTDNNDLYYASVMNNFEVHHYVLQEVYCKNVAINELEG